MSSIQVISVWLYPVRANFGRIRFTKHEKEKTGIVANEGWTAIVIRCTRFLNYVELFWNSLDNAPSSIVFYLEMNVEVEVGVHDIRSRFTPRLPSSSRSLRKSRVPDPSSTKCLFHVKFLCELYNRWTIYFKNGVP